MNASQPTAPLAALKLAPALRQARQQRGLSLAEAAASVKLPAHLLEAMEAGRFAELGAPVFARGYMRTYARFLDVPESRCEEELSAMVAPLPPLTSRRYSSRWKVWSDRYAMKSVYVVLTLAIVLPALFVARQYAPQNILRAERSLDEHDATARSVALRTAEPVAEPAPAPESPIPAAVNAAELETVAASIAPFFRPTPTAGAAGVDVDGQAAAPEELSGWSLRFRADSWVEINDRAGQRLEFGIIKAGSTLHFAAEQLGRVAIGNAGGVEMRRDGVVVDTAAFRRANVARFKVSSAGELVPVDG